MQLRNILNSNEPISVEINPLQMTDEQRQLFSQLVAIYQNASDFSPQDTYTLINAQQQKLNIRFTHLLIRRDCYKQGKHAGEHRYCIIDNKSVGKGGFAQGVYNVLGELISANDYKLKVKVNNRRIVKVQVESDQVTARKKAHREIRKTPPHVHMKTVGFRAKQGKVNSYLFARKFEEVNLFDLLRLHKKNMQSIHRANLCLKIAEAIQGQIHRHAIVHRDLKPANIMVQFNPQQQKFNVNIIDYYLAKKFSTNDQGHLAGTPEYMAPEQISKQNTSAKADVFAFGYIIGEIFGANIPSADPTEKLTHGLVCRNIYKNINVKPFEINFISNLLYRLGNLDPALRPDINTVVLDLAEFANTCEIYHQLQMLSHATDLTDFDKMIINTYLTTIEYMQPLRAMDSNMLQFCHKKLAEILTDYHLVQLSFEYTPAGPSCI